jgi:hypothetical protein
VFTDHRALTFSIGRTYDPWTARQYRKLPLIAEFFLVVSATSPEQTTRWHIPFSAAGAGAGQQLAESTVAAATAGVYYAAIAADQPLS